ncbi:uncharacterized protein RCC_02101 [Ramularia collo-cygni]|uniref:SnoaL-like domain-containing protein n=1 Tax=Ramularia collo-cygni TaxID=112498 RepID=A0A2D3V429_9PEZI|nr:uncharacterized protein RCC_02101 [Ramularia collo-cygni]CZT16259.1 uncharacterized protein RCC_02101 [Ramularia collo-cygni]
MASIPRNSDVSTVLCRLALHSVTCLNEKDFDFTSPNGLEVAACVAEDYRCKVEGMEPATWKQMTMAWRHMYGNPAMSGPDCYFEVENMSALVDERKGTTLVYFNMRWMQGVPITDWVVEHTWKRRTDKKWVLVTSHSVQGSNVKQGYGF